MTRRDGMQWRTKMCVLFKKVGYIQSTALLFSTYYLLDKGTRQVGRFLKISPSEKKQGLHLLTNGLVCRYLWFLPCAKCFAEFVQKIEMSGEKDRTP